MKREINGTRKNCGGFGGRTAQSEERVARFPLAAGLGVGRNAGGRSLDADRRGRRRDYILCGRGCDRTASNRNSQLSAKSVFGHAAVVGRPATEACEFCKPCV